MKKTKWLLFFTMLGLAGLSFAEPVLYLTPAELTQYNGENGTKAYIAVDGVVYDVTGVAAWKKGKHKGNKAGTDVSERINKAPHGKKVLEKLTVVGRLVPGMTLEELKAFNGENGAKAYIAVDGIVYDVTGVAAWKNGKHKGNKAGMDVSERINKAPHGRQVLEKLNVAGKIIK